MKVRSRTRAIDADPLQVLAASKGGPRMAWNEAGEAWVALGAAVTFTARGTERFAILRRRAQDLLSTADHEGPGGPRFVGGASLFADHRPEGLWAGFHAARFWLPERLVQWIDGQAYETTVEVEGENDPIVRLQDHVPSTGSDSRTIWTGRAGRALRSMDRLGLRKVVLARAQRLPAADPDALFTKLAIQEPGTARFLVDPDGQAALVGASPERLVRLRDGHLETHALAGTARADTTRPPRPVLNAPKDDLEHDLVRQHVVARLRSMGALEVVEHPRRLRRLRTVIHLETPIEARAKDLHILDALALLHPTPAVAGYPVDRSLRLIEHVETLPRGWYSGTVGWFDGKGEGNFRVALRCGLLRQDSTWLFAGAGLVPQSDVHAEWDETEAKLSAVRDALGA